MLAIGSSAAFPRASTCCNDLLKQLQQILTDIGETEADKERMLWELEKECLELFRRKVDEAANAKARLHQSVVAKEAELAVLTAALGELNIHPLIPAKKKTASLKEQLALVVSLLEDLKVRREERMKQFADIKGQIKKISDEVSGYDHVTHAVSTLNLEEQDLSLRKLTEYQTDLHTLQKEKSKRIQKILEYVTEVHYFCGILGLDFSKTVNDVHPSLNEASMKQFTNISDSTLEGLEQAILMLKTERKVRFQKLKDIVASIFELWNLMDSTKEEKSNFLRISSVLGSKESDILEAGALSMEVIQEASAEMERLTQLKASRMKELVMKKRSELENICHKAHIEPDPNTTAEKSNALIDSGLVDPCELLANIEAQISKAKNEALSRKEITDKIEHWLAACDEENWLEDYNQDDNRYSGGRGAHINLQRAERARITANKIPAMVDNLINKTVSWEEQKKKLFLYDGVRLVSILEDYKLTRKQREEEKRQYRDEKKLRDMLLTEKEARYGSKPSPRKSNSFRKANGCPVNGNGSMTPTRRNSMGSPTVELLTPRSYSGHRNGYFKEPRRLSNTSLNFVAIAKEDTMSFSSACTSDLGSPRG